MSLRAMQIDGPNRTGRALTRIDVAREADVDEALIRDMRFDNPDLLSLDAAGDADRLIPIVKELNTEAGRIDALFVDPAGRLTIVETKLLSNPQAHREVVPQVIGYAGALAGWTYDDLNDAVESSVGRDLNSIVRERLKDDAAVARFERRLSDRLPRGDFELLIVGDRISEKALRLSDAIAAASGLRFRMSFVELEIYRPTPDAAWPWIVVPRVVERIVDRERYVIRIEHVGLPAGATKPPRVTVRTATGTPADEERETTSDAAGRVGDAETFYKSPDLPDGFGEVFRDYTTRWVAVGGACSPSARLFRWTWELDGETNYPLICKTEYVQINRSVELDGAVDLTPAAHARYLAAIRRVPAAAEELARNARRVRFDRLTVAELTIILDATLALADDLRRPKR